MHRCYIEPSGWRDGVIVPPDAEAHHLVHVMRAAEGTPVAVFDGRGREAEAVVRIGSDGRPQLAIRKIRTAARPAFEITLIIALPKGNRADLIFEKATELGAARIIPLISSRVVVRLKGTQAVKKAERWRRICESAAKQCGTPWLPEVEEVQNFDRMLSGLDRFDAVLMGSLEANAKPLKSVIRRLRHDAVNSLALLIGPEGDFSPEETAAALAAGVLPASFGELTLRAETAAIYALAIAAYEFLWPSGT